VTTRSATHASAYRRSHPRKQRRRAVGGDRHDERRGGGTVLRHRGSRRVCAVAGRDLESCV